jgi:hypothetical protein
MPKSDETVTHGSKVHTPKCMHGAGYLLSLLQDLLWDQ